MPEAISSSQIGYYRENGYLFPLDLFELSSVESIVQNLRYVEDQASSNDQLDTLQKYLRVNMHYLFPFIDQIIRNPKLLDMVSGILGDDILVYDAEFFIKEPNNPKIVSWHQDLTYWGLGETDEELTAWVALSDVTMNSGCMRFIPGSHHQTIMPHHDTYSDNNLLSRGQEVAVEVDESQAVNVILNPGQVSFHHGRIFHASGPNFGDHRRIGLAIRYVTPNVTNQSVEREYGTLVRGSDNSGQWHHVPAPKENFDRDNMPVYEQARRQRVNLLMRGADHKHDAFS